MCSFNNLNEIGEVLRKSAKKFGNIVSVLHNSYEVG